MVKNMMIVIQISQILKWTENSLRWYTKLETYSNLSSIEKETLTLIKTDPENSVWLRAFIVMIIMRKIGFVCKVNRRIERDLEKYVLMTAKQIYV